MTSLRQYLREMLCAGLVLALMLFGFGATAPEQQIGASPAVATALAQSWATALCGGGFADDHGEHMACHACRAEIPLLPPPPCIAEPAFRDHLAIAYAAVATEALPPGPAPRPASRGPPARA